MKTTSNGRGPQNINRGISQQPLYGCDFGVLGGKLEENSEEFLSVALLSQACSIYFWAHAANDSFTVCMINPFPGFPILVHSVSDILCRAIILFLLCRIACNRTQTDNKLGIHPFYMDNRPGGKI